MSDYADFPEPDSIRVERLLPGPIERVWAFLTESDKRRKWLAAGNVDLRPQGKIEHNFRNADLSDEDDKPSQEQAAHGDPRIVGSIVACEPPRLLSYLWGEGEDDPEVTFELEPQGDKVRLVLTQRRTPARRMKLSMAAGWHTHLAILEDVLAERKPASFWSTYTRLEKEYDRLIA